MTPERIKELRGTANYLHAPTERYCLRLLANLRECLDEIEKLKKETELLGSKAQSDGCKYRSWYGQDALCNLPE